MYYQVWVLGANWEDFQSEDNADIYQIVVHILDGKDK